MKSTDVSAAPQGAGKAHSIPGASIPEVELRNCRMQLGRAGQEWVEFCIPELVVKPGEQVALTGPSGCGKSTLLNIISGLLVPDTGFVRIHGVCLDGMRAGRRDVFRGCNIGFVHQAFNLLDGFTVLENLLVGMRFGRGSSGNRGRAHAETLLHRVGLSAHKHLKPGRLSVGERQRVAIARAVANHPALLLADEPTGSLDEATGEEVFRLMLEVCEEHDCTFLMVTHDERLAARLPRCVDCRHFISRTQDAGEPA